MTLMEAYQALELEPDVDDAMLKEQYWWFVRTFHPDKKPYGNAEEFDRAVKAYNIIRSHRA